MPLAIAVKSYGLEVKWKASQAWWYMPTISALGRLRDEECKFEATLG
jgi:hypothetical protein